jgi:type IX secretion system PorP/SprF family membrane protein
MARIPDLLYLFDKNLKVLTITVCLLMTCLSKECLAQYFQFSQYNFTPQRINPAQVGNSDYATLSFDFRNQSTDGGFHLTSNILNASYPIFSRGGRRWSGVGISLMDDRSGQAGIFNTQEVGLSYALNVPLAVGQTISLGFKGIYQNRKFDLDGLYTGAQYVPDRGFSESLTNGENVGQFVSNYITFSAGLYWQQIDKNDDKKAYWGISFFDFNKPSDSFLELENELNATVVVSGGFRVYHKGPVSIFPEFLFTRGASTNVLNAGCITRYKLEALNQWATHVDIITKYVIGRSGIIGLQLHRENISIGFSYDFPVIIKNVANTGAFELGIELKKLVTPKKKNRIVAKKPSVKTTQQKKKSNVMKTAEVQKRSVAKISESDSVKVKRPATDKTVPTAQLPSDTVKASGAAGKIRHEPLILEKATLRFGFEFNSSSINHETSRYLDDLAKTLIDNPKLKIRLTGHTDNVGSAEFNLKLSLQRAQSMKNYLVKKGVSAACISVEGKGLSEPITDNSTAEKRSQNRRVELDILQN